MSLGLPLGTAILHEGSAILRGSRLDSTLVERQPIVVHVKRVLQTYEPILATTLRFKARPDCEVLEAMGCELPLPIIAILTRVTLSFANCRLRYFATDEARALLTARAFD